jgi:hypothetical protein
LVGNYSDTTWLATTDASNTGVDIYDPPAAAAAIAAGASLDISGPSNETVTFDGGTGALVLNDPESFTGQIVGFTGTAPDAAHSDTIDLVGINYDSSGFAEAYNSATGLLTVTDGTNSASITFDDFNATLDFASDGDGGTLITDPPGSDSVSPVTTGAPSSESDPTAPTPNDTPNDWGMKFGDDKIAFEQALNQSGSDTADQKLVGMTGDDNFVFHEKLGAEPSSPGHNFIAEELHDHPAVQTAQELVALSTPKFHDTFIDLIHHDSLPGEIAPAQWHAIIAGSFHLH